MCRLIRPVTDQGGEVICASYAAGAMLSPWRTGRKPANSLDGFHAVPSERLSSLFFYDRQLSFSGISAGPRLASTTAHPKAMRKDTERNCASHKRSQTFRVFVLPGYSIFAVSQTTQPYFSFNAVLERRRRTCPLSLAVPP